MTDASFTGLTRDSWAAVADQLLLSVRGWASPDHARIDLPGQQSAYGPDIGAEPVTVLPAACIARCVAIAT